MSHLRQRIDDVEKELRASFDRQAVVIEAERLGCEIERVEFNQQPDRYYWNFGRRSSADQYAASFNSAEEAAAHFLTTREARNAREADARRKR